MALNFSFHIKANFKTYIEYVSYSGSVICPAGLILLRWEHTIARNDYIPLLIDVLYFPVHTRQQNPCPHTNISSLDQILIHKLPLIVLLYVGPMSFSLFSCISWTVWTAHKFGSIISGNTPSLNLVVIGLQILFYNSVVCFKKKNVSTKHFVLSKSKSSSTPWYWNLWSLKLAV